MKNAVKAVITKAEHQELTLKFDGDHYQETKRFIKSKGLGIGSVVQVQLKDRESKSARQNRTYRLLVQIALQSQLFGDDYKRLHNHLKFTYGVVEDWEDFVGKWHSTLKSTADYTLAEMAGLITGTIDLMLSTFSQNDYYDKRFDEMMQEFNSEVIKQEPKEELEIF